MLAVSGATAETITNLDAVWRMTEAERSRTYDLQIEGRIGYADPLWRNLWFEQDGAGHYAMLGDVIPALQAGRVVRIEGTLVPKEGLQAERVRVTVLAENAPIRPLETQGRIGDIETFDRRMATVAGVVDTQQLIDDTHLRVMLMVEQRLVVVWVVPDDPRHLPDWTGAVVRATGVYSGRVDPTGNELTVEIWVATQDAVAVVSRLADDPRFAVPATSLVEVGHHAPEDWVHVQGTVERREVGTGVLLRGAAGDLWVESMQRAVIPRGAPVEAVGRPVRKGPRWILREGLIRPASEQAQAELAAENTGATTRVTEVRALSGAEAAEGRRVVLEGTVVWSDPTASFFYVVDVTGGLRVRIDPAVTPVPALYKFLRIEGRTLAGPAGPEVELRALTDLGVRSQPEAQTVTVAQALNGGTEAQWVALRGFIQDTESVGDWRRIHVTTPTGEFVALLNSPVNFVANPGSLVTVHGVCETLRDNQGGGVSVQLRVPFLHDLTLEEEAPLDPFAVPQYSLAALDALLGWQDFTRVRVEATVVQATAGEPLVVVDAQTGLQLVPLGPLAVAVRSGDRVEAVGLLGRDDSHLVLRDAVVRRLGEGTPPEPTKLAALYPIHPDLDLRLVECEGRVVNSVVTARRLRLTVRDGVETFDAVLSSADGATGAVPADGSWVRLRGVFITQFGEGRKPVGVSLRLRGPDDLVVLAPPAWFTAGRIWGLAGLLAILALLGGGGTLVLRRRVRQQTAVIHRQWEERARLEAELERDRRLRSIGSLAGGIAHDFNNLLTGIQGNLLLMLGETSLRNRFGDNLKDAISAAKRARALTAQLSTLARGGAPVRQSVELVAWWRELWAEAVPAQGTKEWSCNVQQVAVPIDPEQLGQALRSVIRHCGGGQEPSGRISARLTAEPADPATSGDPERVVITVWNDGPRVEPEALAAIFDPYSESYYGEERFALALALSIVNRHGGKLSAAVPADGAPGTVFRLELPLREDALSAKRPGQSASPFAPVAAAAPAPAEPVPPAPAVASTALVRRILVMDDEPHVARVTQRFLQKLGYEATVTSDGEACIAAFAAALEQGRAFDAVVMDLTVPNGLGGAATLPRLRRLDSRVRAVATSGYSSDPIMSHPTAHGFVAAVRKPFELSEMKEAVIEALRGAV